MFTALPRPLAWAGMSQAFGLKKRGWFGSEALSANRAPAAGTEALLLTAFSKLNSKRLLI
jgi:hypothetical protein